jgi:hypothetical protein
VSCDAGFVALPGWDAATGLGTPLFGEMLKFAVATLTVKDAASGVTTWWHIALLCSGSFVGGVLVACAVFWCAGRKASQDRLGLNDSKNLQYSSFGAK